MVEGPEEETSIGTSSVVGDNRIQTYRKLRLEGEATPYMYVRAGIPTDVVMAEANAALGKNLTDLFLLPVDCLVLLVAIRQEIYNRQGSGIATIITKTG